MNEHKVWSVVKKRSDNSKEEIAEIEKLYDDINYLYSKSNITELIKVINYGLSHSIGATQDIIRNIAKMQ